MASAGGREPGSRPDRPHAGDAPGRSAGRPFRWRGTMTAQPIYTKRDFYVPAFELRLRGAGAPRDVVRDVMQVTFKDSLTDVDSFDIVINNWDADSRTFKYSDDDLFDPGTQVE